MSEEATSPVADDTLRVDTAPEVADEAQAQGDTDASSNEDLSPQEGEDGHEEEQAEIDIDGQKYRVPKALEGAFMKNADYTQKTQEIADQRRSVEAERQALVTRQAAAEAHIADVSRVQALKEQVKFFDEVLDWEALEEQDPDRANKLWRQADQTRRTLSAAETELSTKQAERLKAEQADNARALQEMARALPAKIKGFNAEVAAKIIQTANQTYGISEDELRQAPDARLWTMLHDAHQWRQHQAKQTAGQRQAQAQSVAPIKTVGSKAPPPSPLSDRSGTDAWMRARNEQERRSKSGR